MNKNNDTKPTNPEILNERIERMIKIFFVLVIDPFVEIVRGGKKGTLPVVLCSFVGMVLGVAVSNDFDMLLFKKLGIQFLCPSKLFWRQIWGTFWTLIPFYVWGFIQLGRRRWLLKKLQDTFINCSLQNNLGDFPKFISDVPLDDHTRRLRITNAKLPLSRFKDKADDLGSNLTCNVIKISQPEDNKQLIDIVYSNLRMPDMWFLENINHYKKYSFPIGKTFGSTIETSLQETPHILVAGASGGGKSTFIRMMTSTLAYNNPSLRICMIDFKGGNEAQVFEDIEGIETAGSLRQASGKLEEINKLLDTRFELFKQNKVKDIEAYNQLQSKNNKFDQEAAHLGRVLVVIDEISELVPTIGHPELKMLLTTRNIINRISRLGRSVGVHLVIGTQKPDAKNLDPTIKANLSGIVCFYVVGYTQSLVVLGNKRAADLPAEIKGRAIWQHGSIQEEVQVPFLSENDVHEYFKNKHDRKEENNDKDSEHVTT
ncbi:MAG: hypothetical protein IPM57_02550 [Oligoflexia bacterium]|nr:hypothetical protein [Oligoflexia bacterium]